jgi:hypothetical protein
MGAICCIQRHFGGVSLGLVSVGVQAVKVSILLIEKRYFYVICRNANDI